MQKKALQDKIEKTQGNWGKIIRGVNVVENLFWIGFIGAAIAGLFAVMQAKKVMGFSEGSDKMKKIA